eukprot:scaffold155363_cov35-Tisochrysis_lutea.AAC.2
MHWSQEVRPELHRGGVVLGILLGGLWRRQILFQFRLMRSISLSILRGGWSHHRPGERVRGCWVRKAQVAK